VREMMKMYKNLGNLFNRLKKVHSIFFLLLLFTDAAAAAAYFSFFPHDVRSLRL
jgi:hypothetical protein